jgi:regulator of protease activity HflC (stomatin/prohibitin superfamily)
MGVFIGFLIVVLALLVVLISGVYRVDQQNVAIIERNGRFRHLAHPGLHFKIPIIDRVAGRMSLRQLNLDVVLDAMTRDNATARLSISIQYLVRPDKVYEAFYNMQNPAEQIARYVENAARAEVRLGDLGDVMGQINGIGQAVERHTGEFMAANGYQIVAALVTDIAPDPKVRSSMNEILASQNIRQATINNAEGNRQASILQAEAEKQTKILQGEGIAGERSAIIEGLSESLKSFEQAAGITAMEAMNLILVTNYFDTLKAVAQASETNTLFVNSTSGAVSQILEQLTAAIKGAQTIT